MKLYPTEMDNYLLSTENNVIFNLRIGGPVLQNNMEKKINPHIYLALYCLVLMSIGLYHTSLGPLIPFLA